MAGGEEGWRRSGIEVSTLQFGYDGEAPLFARFNLRVAPGSRCLLIGANGSGKHPTPGAHHEPRNLLCCCSCPVIVWFGQVLLLGALWLA